jgi:hypothetical protein
MLRKPPIIAIVMSAMLSLNALAAGNDACWGDATRQDITCTQLSERLLLSLRGLNLAGVRKAMGVDGRQLPNNGVRFLSNYSKGQKTGGGSVNVTFDNDRVVIISAEIDFGYTGDGAPQPRSMEFLWNEQGFLCSDFPGSKNRC